MLESVSSLRGVLWENLSPGSSACLLPELQCLTPCLAWVRWSGICAGRSRHLVAGLPPPVSSDKVWDAQAFLIAIPGLICCARLIWLQGLVIIYTCQSTCTQAKLVRGPDPHGFNPLPPKDLILLMSSNG